MDQLLEDRIMTDPKPTAEMADFEHEVALSWVDEAKDRDEEDAIYDS